MTSVDLYRWSDLSGTESTCGDLLSLHRIGLTVDLQFLIPPHMFSRLQALPPQKLLAILDDPLTYVHVYHPSVGSQLCDHLETALSCGSPSHHSLCPGVTLEWDGRLHIYSGSQLCPPEVTRTPNPEERAAALSKLDEAFSILQILSPAAHHLVVSMKRRLILRSAPIERFFHASHRFTVGALHFTNLHLERASILKVATTLLHEAIHDSLFIRERVDPLVIEHPVSQAPHPVSLLRVQSASPFVQEDEVTVCSPWTGRELPLDTFTHAAFVWFGLLNLLEMAEREDVFPPADRRLHIEWIRRGFESVPDFRTGPEHARLSAGTSAALAVMFNEVKARAGG